MLSKKSAAVVAVLLGIIVVAGTLGWNYLTYLREVAHDANRWAVIRDVNGDRLAVEASDDGVWNQLAELHRSGDTMFVGGIVERYGNKWGFRLKPGSVTVAEVTAEGLQATIRYLSGNLDYWLGGYAYISSRVVEAHS